VKTYTVRARRRQNGWDLDVKDVGLCRVERLTGADRAIRSQMDVLGLGDSATAGFAYEYASDLEREVRAVRDGRASADAANRFAAERTRALAARLLSEGYSGAEVAMILDVSPQRVSQLVAPPGAGARPADKKAGPSTIDLRSKPEPDPAGKPKAAKKSKKPKKSKKIEDPRG